MNLFKISGKVMKKEKVKGNDLILNLVLAIPLGMKVYDAESFVPAYSYLSISLFGLDKEQYDNLRKGNFVEIIGSVTGNSDKEGNKKSELIILPKTITKGVLK